MRTMLRSLELLFMTLLVGPLSGQVPSSFGPMEDPSGFRQRVEQRADTVNTMRSRFTQVKDMSFMEKKVTSQGRFFFKKPNMVRWEYTEPFEHRIYIRGDKLTIKGEKKEDSYDMGSNEMFRRMNEMIVSSVRGQVFENDAFEPAYYENGDFYLVALEPKEKSMKEFFEKMFLYFSRTEHEVQRIVMVGSSGDTTRIDLEKKRVNVPLSDERFEPSD